MDSLLKRATAEMVKKDLTDFLVGDTVRVISKVFEGGSERVHAFEGVVIRRSGRGISETFTVRKLSYGVGVERIFPVHSPQIKKISVVKSGRVRRAKLYYLRKRIGKAARVKDKKLNGQ
ncbi:50S ribosomal protein L19 [bacterium]|nr:50S ribosomal protein L19 [bacterium]NIN92341.1 50S ribosomal protein L19 [bacterium]NIO18455.1 50S ribosomal protein L19 [bacterium]NIO73451.1 50S ribosomal protein L19 [bacterium]